MTKTIFYDRKYHFRNELLFLEVFQQKPHKWHKFHSNKCVFCVLWNPNLWEEYHFFTFLFRWYFTLYSCCASTQIRFYCFHKLFNVHCVLNFCNMSRLWLIASSIWQIVKLYTVNRISWNLWTKQSMAHLASFDATNVSSGLLFLLHIERTERDGRVGWLFSFCNREQLLMLRLVYDNKSHKKAMARLEKYEQNCGVSLVCLYSMEGVRLLRFNIINKH